MARKTKTGPKIHQKGEAPMTESTNSNLTDDMMHEDLAEVMADHSLDEIKKGLELLQKKKESVAKRKAKIAAGEVTPEDPEKKKARQAKQMAKQIIIMRKAKEAGITATEEEITAYVADLEKRRQATQSAAANVDLDEVD